MVGSNKWPTDTGTHLSVGTLVHFCLPKGESHERAFGSVLDCSLLSDRKYVYRVFVSGKGMFYPVHSPEIMPCILGLPSFVDSMAGFKSSAVCTPSKNLLLPAVPGSREQPARIASNPGSRNGLVRDSMVSTMPAPVIPQPRPGPRMKLPSHGSQLSPATPVTGALAEAEAAPPFGHILEKDVTAGAFPVVPLHKRPPDAGKGCAPTSAICHQNVALDSSLATKNGRQRCFDKGGLPKVSKVSSSSKAAKTSSSGHILCKHKIRLTFCRRCVHGGGSICTHGLQRSWCKACGGKARCSHGKQKSRCAQCGGVGICSHAKLRHRCKVCSCNKEQ